MRKVGILAYCSACNFGAQLQLLSTYYYFKKKDVDAIVIDWIPYDLEKKYSKNCTFEQLQLFENERARLWQQSARCHTAEEIAKIIVDEGIEAIVIGSDAVMQHHPFWECVKFPTKKIYGINHPSSDRLFPNPFWGTFNDYLNKPVPAVILSGSNQDSRFGYIGRKTKLLMSRRLHQMKYISVRDTWTQKMVISITKGAIIPNITPDPVFAFNFNANEIIPSKEDIINKFGLSSDYLLFSFHDSGIVTQQWLNEIQSIAKADNLQCVNLPYADVLGYGNLEKNIDLPLSPIDWYALIKYSKGYIGQNMHPIVVSLHNAVPFYAFDNYGMRKLNGLFIDEKTSKVLHILKTAGFEKNRISCISRFYKQPDPCSVYDAIINFDKCKCSDFSKFYYEEYVKNMNKIEKAIN